ncbi:hypothetical protein NUSPORA_01990 [Nucleospora cyclopteri]
MIKDSSEFKTSSRSEDDFNQIIKNYKKPSGISKFLNNKEFIKTLCIQLSTKDNLTAIKIIYENYLFSKINQNDLLEPIINSPQSTYSFISLYWIYKLKLISETDFKSNLEKFEQIENFDKIYAETVDRYVKYQYDFYFKQNSEMSLFSYSHTLNKRIVEINKEITKNSDLVRKLKIEEVCFLIDIKEFLGDIHTNENKYNLEILKNKIFGKKNFTINNCTFLIDDYEIISKIKHALAEIKGDKIKLHVSDFCSIKKSNNLKRLINIMKHYKIEFYFCNEQISFEDVIILIYFYLFHIDFNIILNLQSSKIDNKTFKEKTVYYFGTEKNINEKLGNVRNCNINQIEETLNNLFSKTNFNF